MGYDLVGWLQGRRVEMEIRGSWAIKKAGAIKVPANTTTKGGSPRLQARTDIHARYIFSNNNAS
jgi:hypothetical protein